MNINQKGTMNYQIENMQPDDWNQVSAIYTESIETGVATFETKVSSWKSWDSSHLPISRLVARSGADVLGWTALSRTSSS